MNECVLMPASIINMNHCDARPLGMNFQTSVKIPSPLVPSSAGNSVAVTNIYIDAYCCYPGGKENASMETNKGWLSKVCNRLRSKHRRYEKCEKCGQRNDTCRPNPSFISGRKHFLCEDCRVSSHNMKNMYHQLCRNLSLREPSRTTTCNSYVLSSPASSRAGLTRSNSLKARTMSPESGYETASSLDSSSSSGHISADPLSTSSGECGRCSPHIDDVSSTCSRAAARLQRDLVETGCSKDNHVYSNDKAEVFGGAFKAERVHLRQIQHVWPQERTYAQQPPVPQQTVKAAHPPHPKGTATKQYDGYLEVRTPNSQTVKYVFTKSANGEAAGHCAVPVQKGKRKSSRKHSENLKQCYRCHKLRDVAFRAPFGHGWLCEDCLDDLM